MAFSMDCSAVQRRIEHPVYCKRCAFDHGNVQTKLICIGMIVFGEFCSRVSGFSGSGTLAGLQGSCNYRRRATLEHQPKARNFHSSLFSTEEKLETTTNDTARAKSPPKNALIDADRRRRLIESFLSTLQDLLHDKSLVSLTIRGPSKKAVKEMDEVRGTVRLVTGRFVALQQSTQIQLTFKFHGATDIVKNWNSDQVNHGLLALFGIQEDASSILPISEWGVTTSPPGSPLGIQTATLETTSDTWELDIGHEKRKPKLSQKKVASAKTNIGLDHDRVKKVPINQSSDFLQALGVTNAKGKPRPNMSSKLRQCQKFVEIVSRLVESSSLTNQSKISVVDMGCGRGYLSFSLHSHLVQTYPDTEIHTRGIDVRPKLVQEINNIANSLGDQFETLHFEEGTIQEFVQKPTTLDILIALHACDTATDDALWSGVAQKAAILVVAPCCHKQCRPQLNRHASQNPQHPMADVLRHNIYRERIAETVTDSVRALLLEIVGYNVQVFEFIGGEHTSKNVMITAVKQIKERSADETDALRERLRALASLHGIQEQKLANWMGEKLSDQKPKPKPLSARSMPPL